MSFTDSSVPDSTYKEDDAMELENVAPSSRKSLTSPRLSMHSPRLSMQSPRLSMTSPTSPRQSTTLPRRSIGGERRRSSHNYNEGVRSVPMGPPRPSIHVVDGEERIAPPVGLAEPPSLDYSLDGRWLSLIWFWGLVFFDSVCMPILLYFLLHYETDLSPNTVFSIVTAALGGVSILEYVVRFWRLWKKGSTCRVIGGRRAHLDWFHWCFTAMWVVIMVELIIGTIPTYPPIRLLSMPLATLLWTFGTELLITDMMRLFRVPSPFRMSSIPKGAVLRPGIYTFIEDVLAVDGSGGTAFRERLNARYEASHYFRQMLHRLTLFWGFGAEGAAILTTALVFTLEGEAAYAVGWSLPGVWAMIWTAATWWYVRKDLKMEREKWALGLEDGEVDKD